MDTDRILPPLLLKTKLTVPPARASLVERPRLMSRLAEGLRRKLTLISAPPGFGKTTLLSAWRTSVAGRDIPLAWLSLDEADNDPTRFWAYLTAAIDMVSEGAGLAAQRMLRSPQPPPIEVVLTELLNRLASISSDIVLVLDDYHVITAPAIHTALTFLLDHLPSQLHLVIASRTDPVLPLARWRARGDMLELRAAELRFTVDEAASFLHEVMGLAVSAENVAILEARTEGWIAGLQLAALSMQGREHAADFISAFAGSHRHVTDYLSEEVLQRQPADVQEFLLRTSILERLCASLCNAVLDVNGSHFSADATSPWPRTSQPVLEALERANLFLSPLDDERRWFRYHQLFAQMLRVRLQQTRSDMVAQLHRRAIDWYTEQGMLGEAIDQALAGQAWELAAALIEQTFPVLWQRGELATLRRWLDALPEHIMLSQPLLGVNSAGVLHFTGQIEVAKRRLAAADAAIEQAHDSAARLMARGYSAGLRAILASQASDIGRTIAAADVALKLLPEDDQFMRAGVTHALGLAKRLTGDIVQAAPILASAVAMARSSGNILLTITALCNVAAVRVAQGRLRDALEIYREALAFEDVSPSLPVLAAAFVGVADILRERNELAAAREYLTQGNTLARHGLISVQRASTIVELNLQIGLGDQEGMRAALHVAEQLANYYPFAPFTREIAMYRARIDLLQGHLEAASAWADSRDAHRQSSADLLDELEDMTVARVRSAQGCGEEALALLDHLLTTAEAAGRAGSLIALWAAEALLHARCGDGARALNALEQALTLALPEQYVHVFVQEGMPMAELLVQITKRRAQNDPINRYIGRLLVAFPKGLDARNVRSVNAVPASSIAEPLTERETEVLQLLAAGMTSTDIAQHFVVSVNTVKTQLKSIYSKLDVHSRAEAIAKARALHLLA